MISKTAINSNAGTDPNRSIRTASLTAGIALLLISALAGFGYFVAVKGLVTPGDPAQTAKDITESSGVFRLGIVSLYLVIPLDIVIAWALYRVFSPVSKSLSMLAAGLRIAFAVVFMVAISQLVDVLRLLNDDYLAVFSPEQLHAQVLLAINAFSDVWHAGLFLFGLHLLIIGYLAFKSGYVPKLIAVLVAIDGLSYAVDTFGTVLSPGPWTDTATFTFIGELLLGLWLVIRGPRLTVTEPGAHNRPTTDPITAAR
jgi:Domain of unknown function (DUF4386)